MKQSTRPYYTDFTKRKEVRIRIEFPDFFFVVRFFTNTNNAQRSTHRGSEGVWSTSDQKVISAIYCIVYIPFQPYIKVSDWFDGRYSK